MDHLETNRVKPEKKRSSTERAIVWGGIFAVLVILQVEWTSRYQFEESVKTLEAAIQGVDESGRVSGIPLADAEKKIQGLTFRTHRQIELSPLPDGRGGEQVEIETRRTYRWPSLFKVYQLALTVNHFDRAILVETSAPMIESSITD